MTRLSITEIEAKSTRNKAAKAAVWGKVSIAEIFGTLTTPPTYQVEPAIEPLSKRSANELIGIYDLPYPPSMNTYWRHITEGKTLLSAKGRAYRLAVMALVGVCVPVRDRLRMEIKLSPPDKRKRDLDNTLKAPLDSLQHAKVFHDDEQIDDLRVIRGPVVKGGKCRISIWTMEGK